MPQRSVTLKVAPVALTAVLALAVPPGPAVGQPVAPPTSASPALPDSDAFYVPPSPLPDGRVGDVIRSREVVAPLYPNATVRQIMYLSSNNAGEPVPVTGALLTPKGTSGTRNPLVVVTPGTRGLGDHCAQSKQLNPTQVAPQAPDYLAVPVQQLLFKGISVVLTDYEGQGTPRRAEYLVGRAEGHQALDALRAATRLTGTGVSETSPVGIGGYSQGGQAAGWAAELQPSYAPELDLKGIVAGGTFTDMNIWMDHGDGNATAGDGFALAALSGLDTAYPELELEEKLTAEGKHVMDRIQQSCYAEYLTTFGTTSTADITEPDVLALPQWRERFAESRLGTGKPGAPAYVYHANADTVVPYELGRMLYRDWCANGAAVEFERLTGVDHLAPLLVPQRGVEWLAARVTGVPARDGCRDVSIPQSPAEGP
ncbi:triacylglycerol lipase [Saccharopolyspora erythraea]|uniref:lipase family protein n=1 Tax=Saccharopolyspora erythraea TaxID=1836 RepID=UPI001BA52D3C|nr:lipase family protein [Saccharopolyspora erythraea]QUH01845.1 triacylglycerol lipase [Saccharopolyspora erythraea]